MTSVIVDLLSTVIHLVQEQQFVMVCSENEEMMFSFLINLMCKNIFFSSVLNGVIKTLCIN